MVPNERLVYLLFKPCLPPCHGASCGGLHGLKHISSGRSFYVVVRAASSLHNLSYLVFSTSVSFSSVLPA